VHLIGLDTSRANVPPGIFQTSNSLGLKADLVKNTKKFTIVFSHHPLLPPPPFDGGPPWDDWILPQGPNVREILGSSRYVRLALSGHVHMSKISKSATFGMSPIPVSALSPVRSNLSRHRRRCHDRNVSDLVSGPSKKKQSKIFGTWQIGFKYNELKPETFADVAEGERIDQNCVHRLWCRRHSKSS